MRCIFVEANSIFEEYRVASNLIHFTVNGEAKVFEYQGTFTLGGSTVVIYKRTN